MARVNPDLQWYSETARPKRPVSVLAKLGRLACRDYVRGTDILESQSVTTQVAELNRRGTQALVNA